jgi:serine/threonine protein kinase
MGSCPFLSNRDLKCQNIMLTTTGVPKLIDMGMGSLMYPTQSKRAQSAFR